MAKGFSVTEIIDRQQDEVWAFLTDFDQAAQWMTAVEKMTQATPGPIQAGTRFTFLSRGAERDTEVTAWEPNKRIALTSTQGGVTATYDYSLAPVSSGTEITLNAE